MLKSKTCSKCGKTKDISAFVKQCSSPDGHCYECKQCRKEYYQKNKKEILAKSKVRYQGNRVKRIENTADYRKRRIKLQPDYRAVENRAAFARKLGISSDAVEEYYKKQFMKQQAHCAICGKITEKLCIDHNHKKQGIDSCRGLLCKSCNYGIGCFLDNPEFLGNAKQYLINNF